MKKQIEEMDLELEQYHKSNAALCLMIGELKLKLEGLRKELAAQQSRVVSNNRLLEHLMRDLNGAYEVRQDHAVLKARVISLYQLYVQGDVLAVEAQGGVTAAQRDSDDPMLQYNRDREQMERNLESLRRSLKTDAMMHKRDLAKMMRENVLLTREINDLRKDAQSMLLQQKAVEKITNAGPKANIALMLEHLDIGLGKRVGPPVGSASGTVVLASTLPPTGATTVSPHRRNRVLRSTALRTSSAGQTLYHAGGSLIMIPPKHDLKQAWREIEMQNDQIRQLESQVQGLCEALHLDFGFVMNSVETGLAHPVHNQGGRHTS